MIKEMILREPFIITPRLMAGLQIGGAFISMENHCVTSDNRDCFKTYFDLPEGLEIEELGPQSGVGGSSLQEGFASLLGFLGAAAESYRYRGMDWDNIGPDDNATLFPRPVVEWAYQKDGEIQMLELEIEEQDNLIEE